MKILTLFEEKIKESIERDSLIQKTIDCFYQVIENKEGYDESDGLLLTIRKQDVKCKFSGITAHLLNSDSRKPFLRVKLDIVYLETNIDIAWYEVEYGLDGNILDDYLDLRSISPENTGKTSPK